MSPGTCSVEGAAAGKSRIPQHPEKGAALPSPAGPCARYTSCSRGSASLEREGHWGQWMERRGFSSMLESTEPQQGSRDGVLER